MIKTHGLTHVALAVKDPDASFRFYETLFGVKEYFRDEASIHVLGPGTHDVIAFEKSDGIDHFGFRLTDPKDITAAIDEAKAIGATIVDYGEFAPGYPFVNILDPDGNQIEIWFE